MKMFTILVLIFILLIGGLKQGNIVATDLHLASREYLQSLVSMPSLWKADGVVGLGEYAITTLWSWPMNVFFGVVSWLGISQKWSFILFGLGPILGLGTLAMVRLSGWAAAIVYLANTYILLLIDGGQISLALAYSLLPLCFYLFKQTLYEAKVKNILQFSVSLWLLSVFDVRIVYFLVILVLLNFIYDLFINHKLLFLNHVRIGLVTGIILVALHAYWLLPAFLVRNPQLPPGYDQASQVSFLTFANWKHALLLQQPHWHRNVFGQIVPPNKLFLVFPVLAILGFALSTDKKKMGYWLAIAIVGIFLAKGNSEPGGRVYIWFFENVPGFKLFRDPTKFYFLIALGYSLLIGEVVKKYKIVALLLVIFLLYLTYPVYSGRMTGTFSKQRFEADYLFLNQFINRDSQWGRVLWVPGKAPLGETWLHHSSLESWRLISLRPFASAVVGTYETMNWLRDATYSGQLLSIIGVKYVIYPPLDPLREEMKPDKVAYYQLFQSQLESAGWAKKTKIFGQLKAIETKSHQDLFWVPAKTWFVVGSDEMLTTGIDLSQEALVFAENNPGTLAQINRLPAARIKLYRKNPIDAATALLPASGFIFPARQLKNDTDHSGWWKRDSLDFLWWRDFLQTKYNLDNQDFDYKGGWAMGEENVKLQISNDKFKKGNVLLARVMKSPKGGTVKFFQKGKLIGQVNTLISSLGKKNIVLAGKSMEYDRAEFGWSEIGEIGDGEIEIRTAGAINTVNVLGVADTNKWQELKSQANEMIFQEPEKTEPATVSYRKISPAHYKVRLESKSAQVLVFGQTFDPLWTANNHGSVEAYGFLNAFPTTGSGEYDVYFTPQKYVWIQWIWDKISETK